MEKNKYLLSVFTDTEVVPCETTTRITDVANDKLLFTETVVGMFPSEESRDFIQRMEFRGWERITMKDFKDTINAPDHYLKGGLECIDVIKAITEDLNPFEAYCTGNVLKYVWRWKSKGGKEDLQKAQKYIGFMLDESR